MTNLAILVTALALAAPAAEPAKTGPRRKPTATESQRGEREVKQIPLDDTKANRIYRIRTAPGYPAIVEFPERFGSPPACGDCGEKGLFRIDVFSDERYLTIKPRVFPGAQEDGTFISADEFITTVNVRLEHFTLTLQVELSEREKADARVVFTVPQRSAESAYVTAEITKARKALEEEFASKIDAGVTRAFLTALAEPHHCTSSSARARRDDVVLEVHELCYFGRNVYVRFTVENRGRAPVDIGEVTVSRGSGRNVVAVDELKVYLVQQQLDLKGTTAGVVGFALADEERAAGRFHLSVLENGGKSRQVTAEGLSF